MGTTEYMRSVGGCALTLECGSHDDPRSVQVAYRAIRNTLAHLGLGGDPPPPANRIEALSLIGVVDKHDAADAFVRDWHSFDVLHEGEAIGRTMAGSSFPTP
jgi:hypothetical protein